MIAKLNMKNEMNKMKNCIFPCLLLVQDPLFHLLVNLGRVELFDGQYVQHLTQKSPNYLHVGHLNEQHVAGISI